MEYLFFLGLVLIIVAIIFIRIKIRNLKYRAKQHVLRNTGLSNSERNAMATGQLENLIIDNIEKKHPGYTEERLKSILNNFATEILNKNEMSSFEPKVYEKMQKDTKLEELRNMEYKRTVITYYFMSDLIAKVVYSDNKDEYELTLNCEFKDNELILEEYDIDRGAVLGF